MTATPSSLSAEQLSLFQDEGYLIVRGLFGDDEVGTLRDEFMALHAAGPVPGFFAPVPEIEAGGDVLKRYPRVMHPHRFNALARRYLLDPRLGAILADLFGEEPLAAQSMVYFKPAGAKGQALHQDNFFLKVEPGTCIAAWVALDPIDQENGGLRVVPGTHRMGIFCPEEADGDLSFTREYVPVPHGLATVPADLAPGDVLFFNGSLVHGSGPNRSADRFRRTFIGHYVGRSSERMSAWYRPILTMAGDEVTMADNLDGGPCGTEGTGPH